MENQQLLQAIEQLLDTKLADMDSKWDAKLAAMETKLDEKMDAKLAAMETRLEAKLDEKMDTKLAAMETRLETKLDEKMDAKLAAMEDRITGNLSTQLAEVIDQQNETMAAMFSEMREEMARGFNVLLESKAGKEIAQVADGVVMNAERITALEKRVDVLEAGTRAS